jgi:signal transduction histidine kinase
MLVSVAPDFRPESKLPSSVLLTLTDVTSGKLASDALRDADHTLRRTISSVSSLQDQLARSEHMASLGLMAAGVAHEINNPLSYILSNLSFAAERAIDQESRLALREALEGAGRVRDIVRDLKTLSRMDSEDELKPLDVRNAVDAALKLAFDEVRHRAKIQRHFSEVPQVLGDETRLVQVMLNLVTNAAQSIAPGAPDNNQISVEVKLADSGEEVEIIVSDTGMGISRTHLPKVFEPFFTTKPAGRGTGLGLSQVYGFARQSGGTASVDSRPGKGSSVSLYLPRAAACAGAATPEAPAASADRGPALSVLVAEDDAQVAELVEAMLRDLGHDVQLAENADAALAALRTGAAFDLLLTDLIMPGDKSGVDLAREAVALRPDLPVILSSGYTGDVLTAAEATAWPLLLKPYGPEQLARAIAEVTVPA